MATILVIEDSSQIHRLVKLIMEKNGFDVDVVESGENALSHLETSGHIPDLILLDIMLPGIDGLKVLRNLGTQDETKSIPVILLTALTREDVVVQGIKLGAKDYIRKPFHPQELVERVSKVLSAS